MLKVFISQATRGRTDEDLNEERYRIIRVMRKKLGMDFDVVNDLFPEPPMQNVSINCPLACLSKSIADLAKANIAVFVPNWMTDCKSNVEHICAVDFGLICIDLLAEDLRPDEIEIDF